MLFAIDQSVNRGDIDDDDDDDEVNENRCETRLHLIKGIKMGGGRRRVNNKLAQFKRNCKSTPRGRRTTQLPLKT